MTLRLASLFAFASFAAFSFAGGSAPPSDPGRESIPIENFHEITPGLYRGARPGPEGLRAMRDQLGVRTIINLEDSKSAIQEDRESSEALGLEWHSIPLNVLKRPKDADIDQVLALLASPGARPAYIHCKAGRDRTGLLVALHRYFADGWRAEDAYNEALKFGFRSQFKALREYFEEKTGYHPKVRSFASPAELTLEIAP